MDDLFFDNMIKIYDIDFDERKLWQVKNQEEFYCLTQGAKRSFYKEYCYQLAGNLVADHEILINVVKKLFQIYKLNVKSDPAKAAGALQIMAISTFDGLEDFKSHIQTFMRDFTIPEIKSFNASEVEGGESSQ